MDDAGVLRQKLAHISRIGLRRRLNFLCPSLDNITLGVASSHGRVEGSVAVVVEQIGTPEDVAEAIVYLLGNGFTTGAILDVDGGARLS